MLEDELKYQIKQDFVFCPTKSQQLAIDTMVHFLLSKEQHPVMILRGFAGTGKTSIASAMVRMLRRIKWNVELLAPTGRAAKVFSAYSGAKAWTIHRRIYRRKSINEGGGVFQLGFNNKRNTLFIVDEASMITTGNDFAESPWGNGNLLDDLIGFVYQGQGCRLMMIGDKAQLPPVGECESPALSREVMSCHGLDVFECDLTDVVRQDSESGILYNANTIRRMIEGLQGRIPRIRLSCFPDIHVVNGDELIESLVTSYNKVGIDETIVVTRSNKRANIYNTGIRNSILDREEILTRGDMLMVVKNNYHWKVDFLGEGAFIANGDRVTIQRVRNIRELYGFHFADITLQMPDYNNEEFKATAILDSLQSEAPALTREQEATLYSEVLSDYMYIAGKKERMEKLKDDVYYNALQIKYAYATTCHKAQGGQWAHVYVDQGYMTDDMFTADYMHWLYTAITRATEHLFLVNWNKRQLEEGK